MSNIITFYSYKGGVGRSMSLSNIAVLLSKWGYKILIIDWDWEAPGLEQFFKQYFDIKIIKEKIGLIDLLDRNEKHDWKDAIIPISIPNLSKEPIHLITSGKRDEGYFRKVRNFNIDSFYESGGGDIIERLRDEWKTNYDFVLIDSRTGVTEIGGVCTVQLPDKVVLLFTATDQGFEGILEIAERASIAQQKLPFDREKLVFIPIPTKIDTQAEYILSQKWLTHFRENLKEIYKSWLPISLSKRDFIEKTKIPYITYFSYGEKLPVIEQGTNDPAGLGYAYETLAALLANDLNDVESLIYNRDSYILRAQIYKNELEKNKNKSFNIFISSAHSDRLLKEKLKKHLKLLSLRDNVTFWDSDEILPGERWDRAIIENLLNADLVLLLITPDYLASDFVQYEFTDFIKEVNVYKKPVVPILAKPSLWKNNTLLSNYQALPRSMKSITEYKDQDEPLIEITNEIQKVISYKQNK